MEVDPNDEDSSSSEDDDDDEPHPDAAYRGNEVSKVPKKAEAKMFIKLIPN